MSGLAGVILCGQPRGPHLEGEDLDEGRFGFCCAGAAARGPQSCTCWTPIFDLEQAPPRTELEVETRPKECGDCAYKPGSPEREADPYALMDLPNFFCHRGIRRPKEWRHPDGRVRPGDPANYMPPIVAGIPYRADGRPAARCGGWAASQEAEPELVGA